MPKALCSFLVALGPRLLFSRADKLRRPVFVDCKSSSINPTMRNKRIQHLVPTDIFLWMCGLPRDQSDALTLGKMRAQPVPKLTTGYDLNISHAPPQSSCSFHPSQKGFSRRYMLGLDLWRHPFSRTAHHRPSGIASKSITVFQDKAPIKPVPYIGPWPLAPVAHFANIV